jgi:hypothetical protein
MGSQHHRIYILTTYINLINQSHNQMSHIWSENSGKEYFSICLCRAKLYMRKQGFSCIKN